MLEVAFVGVADVFSQAQGGVERRTDSSPAPAIQGRMMSASQQQFVERYIDHVMEEAEFQAGLVADYLEINGCKPTHQTDTPTEWRLDQAVTCGNPVADGVIRQAHAFQLNLGAALRIGCWERAGLIEYLPDDLPGYLEALQIAGRVGTGQTEDTYALPRRIFRAWAFWFVHHSEAIKQDVVLDLSALDADQLINELADLLWRCRDTTRASNVES